MIYWQIKKSRNKRVMKMKENLKLAYFNMTFQNDDFKIREASNDDAVEILDLIKISFKSYVKNNKYNKNQIENSALKEDYYEVQNDIGKNIVFIIEKFDNKNKIVGTLRLELKEKNGYLLKRFAILPEYQNQGLGTAIFKIAEQYVKNRKGAFVYLYSSLENHSLIKFYTKLGFECKKIDVNKGYRRGHWFKKYYYRY